MSKFNPDMNAVNSGKESNLLYSLQNLRRIGWFISADARWNLSNILNIFWVHEVPLFMKLHTHSSIS